MSNLANISIEKELLKELKCKPDFFDILEVFLKNDRRIDFMYKNKNFLL